MENLKEDLIEVKSSEQVVANTKPAELNNYQLSIEDKAAHLSLQVNQVIIKPYLNQALDYLLKSRDEVITSYNNLSREIGQDVEFLLETNRILGVKVAEAKHLVAETQTLIRNRYSEANEFEISSGALNLDLEYNSVAENYERSMQLSQEIIKNRMRVESLLETQKLLDNSLSTRVVEIQVEIDNLTLLLDNLHVASFSGKSFVDLSKKFTEANKLSHLVTKAAEEAGYNMDKSLYEHIKSSHVAHNFKRLVNGEVMVGTNHNFQVDEKELFVVKRNQPVNLAKVRNK